MGKTLYQGSTRLINFFFDNFKTFIQDFKVQFNYLQLVTSCLPSDQKRLVYTELHIWQLNLKI